MADGDWLYCPIGRVIGRVGLCIAWRQLLMNVSAPETLPPTDSPCFSSSQWCEQEPSNVRMAGRRWSILDADNNWSWPSSR